MITLKLWLLEILACPIDHAYPLALTVFRWQDEIEKSDKIAQLLQELEAGQEMIPKKDSPLQFEIRDSELLMKDYLIIKPTPIINYLQSLLDKIKELSVVEDKSTWSGNKALDYIKTKIQNQLEKAMQQIQQLNSKSPETIQTDIIPQLVPALTFLNAFKYLFEIEDGVIRCPKCKRWFPIFESIPQMLPDDLRSKEHDVEFKSTWASKYKFE